MHRSRTIACALWLAGCGRVDFDMLAASSDAVPGDAGPPCVPFDTQIVDASIASRPPLAWNGTTYGLGILHADTDALFAAVDPAGTVAESSTVLGTSTTNSLVEAIAATGSSFVLGWSDLSMGHLSFVDATGNRLRADVTSNQLLVDPAWTGSELGVLLLDSGAGADFERVTGDGVIASSPVAIPHGLAQPRFSHLVATGTGYVVAATDIAPLPNPVPLHVYQLDATGAIVHDTTIASLADGNEFSFDATAVGSEVAVAYDDGTSVSLRLVHADGTAGAPITVAPGSVAGEVAIAATGTQISVFSLEVNNAATAAIRAFDTTGAAIGTPEDLTLVPSGASSSAPPSALGLPDRVLFAAGLGGTSLGSHQYLVQRCP